MWPGFASYGLMVLWCVWSSSRYKLRTRTENRLFLCSVLILNSFDSVAWKQLRIWTLSSLLEWTRWNENKNLFPFTSFYSSLRYVRKKIATYGKIIILMCIAQTNSIPENSNSAGSVCMFFFLLRNDTNILVYLLQFLFVRWKTHIYEINAMSLHAQAHSPFWHFLAAM